MARLAYDFSIDVDIGPEAILAAATDFGPRRPELWPAITRSRYLLLQRGDQWAEVVEGTGPVWSRERYDWTTPGLVIATQVDSNAALPGGVWQMRVVETSGGGSRIDIHLQRTTKGLLGWTLAATIKVLGGDRFLALQLRRTVRQIGGIRKVS